jgi:hypothetical protein
MIWPRDVWEVARANITRETRRSRRVVAAVPRWATPLVADEDREFVAEAFASCPIRPMGPDTWSRLDRRGEGGDGRKGKGLFMPLRKAVTGREKGPEMADVMRLLQKEADALGPRDPWPCRENAWSSRRRVSRLRMAQANAVFLTGNLFRHISVMSLTASVGLMAVFLVDFVDMIFISMLGKAELAAAVGYAGAILFFTTSVGIGMAIAGGALVARASGPMTKSWRAGVPPIHWSTVC